LARASVLIVDDDAVFRAALRRCLEGAGYEVAPVADAEGGLALLEQRSFDLVLTDLRMPGVGGIELVRRIKAVDPDIVCIVVTGFGSTERSIEALEAGAFWFVDKSYDRIAAFGSLIQKGLEYRQLQASNRRLQRQLEVKYGFDNIIGESDALKATLRVVRKVAESDATVLVLGESGVGKELVARAVHYNSRRAAQPFVTINCGAIPEELLESELFGHVRGAFTGAVRERVGRFRSADGGTLFLDEIGDMSPQLQVKLLRVLQEREFEPVGSSTTESVNVRIIAATNQDLAQLIRERRFREDLYFRLSVVPIEVPPLRERREDIPLLVEHYLRELSRHHPGVEGITQGALKRLCEHDWPGNVRELVGTLERMVVLRGSGWLDERDVGSLGRAGDAPLPRVHLPAEGVDFTALVDAFETDLIRQALETTGWNKNQAAHLLDLKRTTLVEKIRAKGLVPPDSSAAADSDEPARRAAPTES
jgi:DNA-binding NtrC family response regulator